MGFILSLLGNKNVWIILVVCSIIGGVWLKIHWLERDVAKAQEALAVQVEANNVLKSTSVTLKQSLDTALAVNDANSKLLESLKADQAAATDSLAKLATDLSASKATLSQARAKLAATKLPAVPVPQRIADTIVIIQDSRTEQAIINKQAEEALK